MCKGKLFDVAIKIVNTSKKHREEFMSEAASISKTCHINVVTLLGFCLEGHNGSLDKLIHRKGPETITPFKLRQCIANHNGYS